jgi:hypothetical protein
MLFYTINTIDNRQMLKIIFYTVIILQLLLQRAENNYSKLFYKYIGNPPALPGDSKTLSFAGVLKYI